jgi:hypothetical protein
LYGRPEWTLRLDSYYGLSAAEYNARSSTRRILPKAETNAQLIRDYIDSVRSLENGTEADKLEHHTRFYHPELTCVWTGRSPFTGTFTGSEFFENWSPRWLAYDVRIVDFIDVLASDDRVAILIVEEYTHRQSREVLVVDRIALYEIKDDKIWSMTVRDTDPYASDEYWNRTSA